MRGLAPRGRFPPDPCCEQTGNSVSKLLRKLGFSFRDRGRIRTGSGPAARPAPSWPRPSCYGPAPADRTAPAPTPRPGMLSGPSRAGPAGLRGHPRLPAPAQPADATSRCCGSFPESYVLKRPPKSRRAGCGRRRPRGVRAASRRVRGLAAGVALGRRRRPGAPRGQPRAGRARRGLLSELSPLPVGWASPAPQPPPRSLPGDVYLGRGVRSRRLAARSLGSEDRCAARERQDVRQGRGRQGERRGERPLGALLPLLAGCRAGRGGGGWRGRGRGRPGLGQVHFGGVTPWSRLQPGPEAGGSQADGDAQQVPPGSRARGAAGGPGPPRRLQSLRECLVPGETVWFRSDVTVAGMRAPATRLWDGTQPLWSRLDLFAVLFI